MCLVRLSIFDLNLISLWHFIDEKVAPFSSSSFFFIKVKIGYKFSDEFLIGLHVNEMYDAGQHMDRHDDNHNEPLTVIDVVVLVICFNRIFTKVTKKI